MPSVNGDSNNIYKLENFDVTTEIFRIMATSTYLKYIKHILLE